MTAAEATDHIPPGPYTVEEKHVAGFPAAMFYVVDAEGHRLATVYGTALRRAYTADLLMAAWDMFRTLELAEATYYSTQKVPSPGGEVAVMNAVRAALKLVKEGRPSDAKD